MKEEMKIPHKNQSQTHTQKTLNLISTSRKNGVTVQWTGFNLFLFVRFFFFLFLLFSSSVYCMEQTLVVFSGFLVKLSKMLEKINNHGIYSEHIEIKAEWENKNKQRMEKSNGDREWNGQLNRLEWLSYRPVYVPLNFSLFWTKHNNGRPTFFPSLEAIVFFFLLSLNRLSEPSDLGNSGFIFFFAFWWTNSAENRWLNFFFSFLLKFHTHTIELRYIRQCVSNNQIIAIYLTDMKRLTNQKKAYSDEIHSEVMTLLVFSFGRMGM